MKLINIGYGNMVSAGRVVAIVSPESAPIKIPSDERLFLFSAIPVHV